MITPWLASHVLLWGLVLGVGFLLLGTLRALARANWRLDQLEATTPHHMGRDGLKPGVRGPDFSLPSAGGGEVALHDFAGRDVLLVFTQASCGPCRAIVPDLNQLARREEVQVLVVNRGSLEATEQWASETKAAFPVLVQSQLTLSKRYEVFATPFAFVIDQEGMVAARGIIHSAQHLHFLLGDAASRRVSARQPDAELVA